MTEKPKYLIKRLTGGDFMAVWLACILTYMGIIAIFTLDLVLVFKTLFLLYEKWFMLFSASPDIKLCILLALLIVLIFILSAFAVAGAMFVLGFTCDLLNNKIYKLVALDEDYNIIGVKYNTLDWLTDNGYKLTDGSELDDKNIE